MDMESELEPDAVSLHSLPLETLHRIGQFCDGMDLSQSVRVTSKWLSHVFTEESFWEQRVKCRHPHRFNDLLELRASETHPSANFWRHAQVSFERKNQIFSGPSLHCAHLYPWNIGNQHKHFWNITSVTFCNHGELIAAAFSDPNSAIVWDISATENQLPVPILDQSVLLHTNKISSIQSEGSILSTGSWDKSILLSDLTLGLRDGIKSRLRTEHTVEFHSHQENLLVAGTTEGFYELFDLRTDGHCFTSGAFAESLQLQDQNISRRAKPVIISPTCIAVTGWESRQRLVKLLDLRNGQYICTATLPYGNGSLEAQNLGCMLCTSLPEMQVDEGHLWCGAENSLWRYRISDLSLDLAARTAFAEPDFGQIVGMHPGHGHVLLVRETDQRNGVGSCHSTMYESTNANDYHVLWENTVAVFRRRHISTAFHEDTCKLALAMSDGIMADRISLYFPVDKIAGCKTASAA